MKLTKIQLFILLGTGLAASGIVTIVLTYLGLSQEGMFVYQPLTDQSIDQTGGFNLEEIHSDPLARHDHVLLTVLVDGQQAVIPEGIGMNSQLWNDHSLDKYGSSGISPMHTHNTSGTIHIESTVQREYTVGEFLKVAGIGTVNIRRMTVDGNEIADFQNHAMKNGERIQIEITE